MPSFVCNIDAVQDLHGYDSPWVGGAGKNKLPMTVDGIKAANTDGTWTGNAYVINGITYTILTDSNNNVIGIKANGTAICNILITNLAIWKINLVLSSQAEIAITSEPDAVFVAVFAKKLITFINIFISPSLIYFYNTFFYFKCQYL